MIYKDLLPFGWEGDNLPVEPSEYLPVLIIKGSFENPEQVAQIKVKRGGFYGRAGWELKDCVVMGLPQSLRFELCRDCRRVVLMGIEGYVLLI